MMDVFRFIQMNFWILLAMCGVVFALGIFLWLMGTAMRKEGDARLQAIRDREETEARTAFWNRMGFGRQAPSEDFLYPPLADEDYDPIEDY
jgi:hypothetical protein